MAPKSQVAKVSQRSDLKYKEIKRLLAKKEREKRDNAENIIEEYYVDSSRMIAVTNTDDDLRTQMSNVGIKKYDGVDTGEATAKNYVRLAHYHMKAGRLDPGLYYLEVALSMDPNCLEALTSLSRCQLLMGHWLDAMKASEIVMSRDRNNVSAILVKAESLYNTCFFEHGLILFHRGKALAPENEEFRLGIQKCHKTIENSVSDPEIFTFKGSSILFKLLSTAAEMQDGDGLQKYGKKNKSMSFKGLLTNIAQSKMADISKMAKSEKESKANEKAGLDGLSMTQLAEVEKILGGGNMQTFDSKADHEKLTSDAKTKSMKLFGDAKERKAAKKKEAQKQKDEENENDPLKKKKKKPESFTSMMMKAEISSAAAEEEKAKKLKERMDKIQAAKAQREKKSKKRIVNKSDRLLDDKVYLSMLAEGGIGIRADMEDDLLNEEVTYEAKEAIDFLNSREKFWDQLELGSQNNRVGKEKQAKTMGSLRWLM